MKLKLFIKQNFWIESSLFFSNVSPNWIAGSNVRTFSFAWFSSVFIVHDVNTKNNRCDGVVCAKASNTNPTVYENDIRSRINFGYCRKTSIGAITKTSARMLSKHSLLSTARQQELLKSSQIWWYNEIMSVRRIMTTLQCCDRISKWAYAQCVIMM